MVLRLSGALAVLQWLDGGWRLLDASWWLLHDRDSWRLLLDSWRLLLDSWWCLLDRGDAWRLLDELSALLQTETVRRGLDVMKLKIHDVEDSVRTKKACSRLRSESFCSKFVAGSDSVGPVQVRSLIWLFAQAPSNA
jgi:hypothetical protein